ncbi:hypothetical protein OFO29_18635, partial [Escherichia coli]
MHSWKKKLVVSQLALACTLAITSQANATTYNTWTYGNDSNLLIVFYVQIMPDDFVMQLHR